MKTNSISVVINTKNSSETLERTLKSVSWADEIVVVDTFSTDNTVEVAKKFTRYVYEFPKDINFVEPARNFAIQKATGDWIFILDADEEIPPGLAKELPKLTQSMVDVYDIPRKNIVFNKWLKHAGWWPDYQRRFFRKGHVVWNDAIHSIPTVKGKVSKLPQTENSAIIHHNYQSIEQFIDRLNRYTSIEASQNKDNTTNGKKIINQSFSELFRRYFKEEGYKDNIHGLSVTFLQMFYQVITQLKIWQNQNFQDLDGSISNSFPQLISDLKYWHAFYKSKTSKNPLTKIYWRIRMKFKV